MPDYALENAVETFSASIEGVIAALGSGIADAQKALDQNSINTQAAIDADPVLSGYGIQATWYQMPRVELQLKLALAVAEQRTPTTGSATAMPGPEKPLLPLLPLRLVAQPVSAAFQNNFNYNAQAASTITLSIVPVPSPRSGDQSVLPPHLTNDQVQSVALASTAKFTTTTDSTGKKIPVSNLRFDINFNAAARLWYVLQYDPSDPTGKAVVVAVDDQVGSVRVIST